MPWTPPASAITWQDFPNLSTAVSAAHLNQAEGYSVTVGQSVVDYEETVRPTVLLDPYYDAAAVGGKTAAINTAAAAAQAIGGALDFKTGRVYSLDTGPLSIAPGAALTIRGNGATLQANWGKPRCIDFTRTADDQTWNNIDIRDLIFDANNLTAVTNQSVVGNVINGGGVNFSRVNFQSIYVRRCRWINVHTAVAGDGTASVSCFDLECRQLSADQPEAQNTMIDIRVEQAYARGGNYGFKVNGTSDANVAVNVYLDRIYLDFDWDSGVVQSGTAQAGGNQIGSLGFGDYCEVHMNAANGGDVNMEIDGMQTAHVWGRSTDPRNIGVFGRNFHAPLDAGSQKLICHGVEARVTAALSPDPSTYVPTGFQAGHTSTPNPTFGELVLEDCKYRSATANLRANGSAINVPQSALVSAVTIVGAFTATYDAVSDAPGSAQGAAPIFIAPATAGAFTLGGGGNIRIAYAGTGNANTKPRSMIVSPQAGCTMIVNLGRIAIASSLAGVSAGNTRGLFLGLSGAGGGSIRGRIRSLGWESFSGADTTPQLYLPSPSTTITIDGRLVIDEIDLRKDPAASPAIVNTAASVDTTNKALLPVRSAILPTYPIASVAMGASNFATATFTTATGNQYIGALPAEIHFATGTGAAITLIDVSKDGTTYENAYTQASGAMAQSVIVPVETGDFVKVTFATTQPTTRVRFRRAQ